MGRLFGTNGVRGIVNEDLTIDLAVRLGKAIGTFFKGTVVIASDTRRSGGMIKGAVSSGLMASGADIIDIGMLPTPAMQHYVGSHRDMAGGVMITASHNPPQFNGIKCVGPTGRELAREVEEEIEALYDEDPGCNAWDAVGTISYDPTATEAYVDSVVEHVDAESIRNANLTAVLDCANGAAFATGPMLLSKLGVRAITLNANPQGDFPGHPSEPTEENLKDIISLMRTTKADVGIAHDGDADRTVFITDAGEYVGGEKSLSIMSKYVLSKKSGLVVTPVSSSSMVEEVVKAAGGDVMYTAVGSPVVAKAMFLNNAVFGGEDNGGMIFPEHQLCRDGAMAAAKMLECIVKDGKLSEQMKALPIYHTIRRKIKCPNELKIPLVEYLMEMNKDAKADTTDGLKLLYKDGWMLARSSGTEPIFRIYSESKDAEKAMQRANEIEIKAIEFIEFSSNANDA
ncbi:MAG: phosphoglucosamine mutase [Methanomassiliicoccaceae archaeon]|jgi:phosphomannomutase/phosphoglucomutase|nr:phosphoglucosamine mutase [Methanomassiliicoccaceae archaeon]